LAEATDRLKARRSAILLRSQRGRERQKRADALRADRAHRTTVLEELTLREQRDAQSVDQAVRLQEEHEAIRGRVVGLDALARLTSLEQTLEKETVAMEAALAQARDRIQQAEGVLADATAALRSEEKVTRRRETLADRMQEIWSRSVEMADEAEAEEQVAENWKAG
jgi:hypothetical protein